MAGPMAEGWYQDPLTERWWDGRGWSELTRVTGQIVPDGLVSDPAAVVPAGWYPDPRAQRRWNGSAWTGETRRVPDGPTVGGAGAAPGRSAGPAKRPLNLSVLIGLAVLAVIALAVGAVVVVTGGGDEPSVAGRPTSVDDADDTADDPTGDVPVTKPTTESSGTLPPKATTTTVPPTTTTTTTLPPIADHPYFRALARWDEAAAVDMLGQSVVGSPAWAYARNLQQGFRAGASPTGISTITATGPDSMDHCIGSTCFVLSEVTTDGDRITSFSVDRSPIDSRVVAWSLGDV